MGQAERLRCVFMGTPDLAATVLETVLAWSGKGRAEVVGVYCQPDKPSGRGLALHAPPVKQLAESRGIPVFQPKNFKAPETVHELASLRPDYLLVAAYGLILPQRVLDIPGRKPLNVHTSLLPLYRGAAPIQRAVMDGRRETGVSIMVMEAGMDTGPVVLQEALAIAPDDTAGTLHDKLAALGGGLLLRAIEGLEAGALSPVPQDDTGATYAPKLTKADGRLDFSQTVDTVHARARGVTPWPGAFGFLDRGDGESLQVAFGGGSPCRAACRPEFQPGGILPDLQDAALGIACADGVYRVARLKPAGKQWMDAPAFANGYLKGQNMARFLPSLEQA